MSLVTVTMNLDLSCLLRLLLSKKLTLEETGKEVSLTMEVIVNHLQPTLSSHQLGKCFIGSEMLHQWQFQ